MTMNGIENGVEFANTFWDDTVGDLLAYLCEPRPGLRQILRLPILSRAVLLKRRPELVMSGQKIIVMKMEHIEFIDSMLPPFPAPQAIHRSRSDSSERVVPSLL